jgi:magnesium-transporting ATPase (P-type)
MFDEIAYTRLIYFRAVDFIVDSIPAVLQIYINLLHTFSLVRLNANDIIGTECDKTVSGARIETMCFDKTGTLTQN